MFHASAIRPTAVASLLCSAAVTSIPSRSARTCDGIIDVAVNSCGVVGDRAAGEERHPGLLLPGGAVDRFDVGIARTARRVETGQPARLRRPRQHHVVAGHRLAVGVHRRVGDLVVQHQRLAPDDRHRAEVVVGDDLPVRAVVSEAGEHPGERCRCRRRGPGDRVWVVGRQRPVDGVVELLGGLVRAGCQRQRRDQQRGRGDDHRPVAH